MPPKQLSLNSPQVQAAMRYHRDGMVDLYMGMILVLAGTGMLTDMAWMSGVWVAVFLPLWQSSKRTLTAQRLSEEELATLAGTGARSRVMVALVLALVAGVLIALLLGASVIPSAIQETLRTLAPFILVGTGVGVLAMVAYKMGANRFYGYALGFLALSATVALTAFTVPGMFIGMGLLMAAVGSWLLWQFLQSHPRIQAM